MRGKGDFPTVPILFFEDHPRLCGEKVFRRPELLNLAGSPPPMRGKDFQLALRAKL